MRNNLLKLIALLVFIGGITTFVVYRSGVFSGDEPDFQSNQEVKVDTLRSRPELTGPEEGQLKELLKDEPAKVSIDPKSLDLQFIPSSKSIVLIPEVGIFDGTFFNEAELPERFTTPETTEE